MDIKTMTIEQLKALAFDQFVLLQQTQQNLAALQAEIKSKSQVESNPEL